MDRAGHILAGLLIVMAVASGCTATSEPVPPTAAPELRTYANSEYRFSLAYPDDWMIENDSYQQMVLVPVAESSWRSAAPSDIPKDPHMRLEMGGYIREKIGPANFPPVPDANNLKAWLEQKVRNREAKDLLELTIHNVQAFELTEVYESTCQRVVYWRPGGAESLIRVSTGCESTYLKDFDQIVGTIRQLE